MFCDRINIRKWGNYMFKNKFNEKYVSYIIYLLNSLMLGFSYILFQRKYLSIGGMSEPIFSLIRFLVFLGFSSCIFLIFVICSLSEKKNKFERFVQKVSNHPMSIVVSFTLLFRVWYLSHFNSFVIYYDSKTYTRYDSNIFLGETDIFRTPGYPYFLKLVHIITGNPNCDIAFYESLSLIQSIISLASVVLLYFAGRKLFSNKYILSFCCLVYGIAPSVFTWDIITLTESISMFCTVLLIYIVFSYLAKPSAFLGIVLGLYSFGMIMIRPSFIYLTAVLAVFFIARIIFNANERKKAIAGLLSVVLCIGMIFGYQGLNYKNHEYFTISSVSTTVNKLCVVMFYDWVENIEYPVLSQHIKSQMNIYEADKWIPDIIEMLPYDFSYKEIDAYVNSCIENHKSEYNRYIANNFYNLADEKIAEQYTPIPEGNYAFEKLSPTILRFTFPFTFGGCFVLVFVSLIFSIVVLVKKKRICWHIIGLCAIIFSHIFVSVIGAMAEYARLSSMVIPAVLLLFFYLIDYVVKAIKTRNVFCLNDSNSSAIQIKKEIKDRRSVN